MLVKYQPLPSIHCISQISLRSFFLKRLDFTAITFYLLPYLLECHKNSCLKALEINTSRLIADKIASLFYLLLHLILIIIKVRKPDFYFPQFKLIYISTPQMHRFFNLPFTFPTQDIQYQQLRLSLFFTSSKLFH